MTKEEQARDARAIVAAKASGLTWAELGEIFPYVSDATMRRIWRESQYERPDLSPEGLAAARQRQAAEVRAAIDDTMVRLDQLKENPEPPADDYGDKATKRIETDTDRFVKLVTTLDKLHQREAKLLGLDHALKVEHSGRVELNQATAELEALVAELAGGGMLMSLPSEILDDEGNPR